MNYPPSPHMLPIGEPHPPEEEHAVSASFPTWESVRAVGMPEKWAIDAMKTIYPRFGYHPSLKRLSATVLDRLNLPPSTECIPFPSSQGATRCIQFLKDQSADAPIHLVRFYLPESYTQDDRKWSQFYTVLFDSSLKIQWLKFWAVFGDGIASRHADFILDRLKYLETSSENTAFQSVAPCSELSKLSQPEWVKTDADAKEELKSRIAEYLASEDTNQKPATSKDVILYAKGMCAITAVARALIPDTPKSSEVVIYGYPYSDTPKCVGGVGYERFTLYAQGSKEDLDDLEASLLSGKQISSLFCEIPGNPILNSPDLHRIRDLADRFGFVVVCDETLGTFINVDILPYVDVVITSLTKIFSGASNVMGGSVVLNPQSTHYNTLYTTLMSTHTDTLFPTDATTLLTNSTSFPSRLDTCNKTTLSLATFCASHPSIKHVYHPAMVSTTHSYNRYRRPNGGYGFLFSMTFHNPNSAVIFYDELDIYKGPSVGTNFSLALPYTQLTHTRDIGWAEKQGIPSHIIRFSIGLEREDVLIDRFERGFKEVERHEEALKEPISLDVDEPMSLDAEATVSVAV